MLIGSDPEFFIGEYVDNEPSLIPPFFFVREMGLKIIKEDNKHPIFIENDEFNIMMDGAAFEATMKPAKSGKELFERNQKIINELGNLASKFGLELFVLPTINFDVKRFYHERDPLFKRTVIFGCDRDQDALNPFYLCEEQNVETYPYRHGGGHIHLSDKGGILYDYVLDTIRLMAITVGNIHLVSSKYPELEKIRSKSYGSPGRYRSQEYNNGDCGIEYRTPSNSWIESLETTERIFNACEFVYSSIKEESGLEIMQRFSNPTIEAITESKPEISNRILEELKL